MDRAPSTTAARFAVVDIGSNTVKLSVYVCSADGELVALHHDADTVRIGYRVAETGRIDDQRRDRLIATLQRYEQVARTHGATTFFAVATQAFRIASNTIDVVEAIARGTSWTVRVIDAVEETALTIAGAVPWLIAGESNVVADIGGASTEVIAIDTDGSPTGSASVPIGSGLLFDELILHSPPPESSLERVRDRAAEALDASGVLPEIAQNLLLPGGTGQYLGMLLNSLEPGNKLAPDRLATLHEWLARRHAIETLERIPIQLDRAQVLPASLAIVEALVLRIRPHRIMAVPSGIRDGVARTICQAG
jgi:exopolyphosphatase / guanosine-5'-triphosphate,3'-diphosphate pyrophosphatase